ncbi:MAG: aminoglycoside nucleotidyltransferase [Chloroflexi bacterium]|nr:aminoglycoside nucleotidyltransferase [Chloroflexota bacterium]
MAQEITLEDMHRYLDLFAELDLKIWIDGGWGVDALLGEQSRHHEDLDFLIEKSDSDRLVKAIRQLGFEDVHTDDHRPWNFVMGTASGKNFDFHVIEQLSDGNYRYGSTDDPIPVTAESIDATGTIGGRSVRCPTAAFQINSHSGYQLKQQDIDDVRVLSEKFGIPLLPDQLAFCE